MRCPDCEARLTAALIIETTDDERPVHTDHQWWRCPGCQARFFAILVEDRTNIFSDDLVHTGYRVESEAWEASKRAGEACPRPRDKHCTCPVHRSPPRLWGAQAWYSS